MATQEWREAEQQRDRHGGRNKIQRPGVVFDVAHEEREEDKRRPKPLRSSRQAPGQAHPSRINE